MRKLIAAINITLDGYCDHTVVNADDELHEHYNELMRNAGILLYGRVTYQLMEDHWPAIVKTPTGNKPIDEFAVLIDAVPKLVFSTTLKSVSWENARLATKGIQEEIQELKQQPGNDIFVGSPGLIASTAQLGIIDEFQLCVHPVLAGKGLHLFKNMDRWTDLKLLKTKAFKSGAIVLYYEKV